MIAGAFDNPVLSSQSTFRAVMDATARPGSIVPLDGCRLAPAPLSFGAAAIALTLLDHDSPFWLDPALSTPEVRDWLRFHTGAPVMADSAAAIFAFIGAPAALPAFERFNPGSPEYPDRSATLVLQVETFEGGTPMSLAGPGIKDRRSLRASPLPDDMAGRLVSNRLLFPRGIDLLLVTEDAVAAIPRSVRCAFGES